MNITIRRAMESDAENCGRISYEGFRAVNEQHGLELNFPSAEEATRRLLAAIRNPMVFGSVAQTSGHILGFGILSERDPIRAVGPIVTAPAIQGQGVGRLLLNALIDRARDARGVRLLQNAFNVHSLSLYATLGFESREHFV